VGGRGYEHSQETDANQVAPEVVASPHHRGQDQLGNTELQERMNDQSVDCGEPKLPNPVPATGELSYYTDRHNDFLERYRFCGLTPPNYYLGYGKKYVQRFTFETHHRLTPDGQAWLARARVLLQEAIEGERAADPAAFERLERDDAAFTRFAYDTHPDAYWNAGLGELDIFDLSNIGLTPDARDLFGWDGILQVADIGSRLGGVWGSDAIDYIYGEGSADMALEGMLIAYDELGQEIDGVFGEGTAHILEQTMVQTGDDLVSIGQSLHGYASDAAETAVGVSDSVFGEGATEQAINDAGAIVSDGVDWIEDGYREASGWAEDLANWWDE